MSDVRAWQVGRRTGAIRGEPEAVYQAMRTVGVVWRWHALTHSYHVPLRRFDDVLAALEMAGHRVEIEQALW